MRLSRCIRPLLLVMLIVLASMFTTVQPTRATSPLTVWLDCESLGGGPPPLEATFLCRAVASGGTGVYSYSWSGDGTAWPEPLDEWRVYGSCIVNAYSQVTVTVTDSASNTDTTYDGFKCYDILP